MASRLGLWSSECWGICLQYGRLQSTFTVGIKSYKNTFHFWEGAQARCIIRSLVPFFPCPAFLRNQNLGYSLVRAAFLHHRCSIRTTGGICWGKAVIVAGFGGRRGEGGMWSKEGWADVGLLSPTDKLLKRGFWPTASEQRQFCSSCPVWEQRTQLESETLPSILCWVLLPRICWVCLLLSPAFVQSGALPGTPSPPSFLVATGAGLDHPVVCVCCRQLPGLCLALQCQRLL